MAYRPDCRLGVVAIVAIFAAVHYGARYAGESGNMETDTVKDLAEVRNLTTRLGPGAATPGGSRTWIFCCHCDHPDGTAKRWKVLAQREEIRNEEHQKRSLIHGVPPSYIENLQREQCQAFCRADFNFNGFRLVESGVGLDDAPNWCRDHGAPPPAPTRSVDTGSSFDTDELLGAVRKNEAWHQEMKAARKVRWDGYQHVIVHGLSRRKEWNGWVGVVLKEPSDESNGRYHVAVAQDFQYLEASLTDRTKQPKLKPENLIFISLIGPRFENGQHVQLHSLVSKPEWNGWIGKVRGFDESTGRYVVVIAMNEEALKASSDLSVKKFKLENLQLVPSS